MEKFKNVNFRYLNDNERNILTKNANVPIVIEPIGDNSKKCLIEFATHYSHEILANLTQYGALLFRGFQIKSEKEFEEIICAIRGLKPMDSYFMAELGRTLVEGSKYVHYTNKNFKTGGSVNLGGFHTENYYTCDVPHYINFFCLKPSWFGGETGLVPVTKVYNEMPQSLKKKLEEKTFLTKLISIRYLAKAYSLSEHSIYQICRNLNIPVNRCEDGEDLFTLYKPSIIIHPEKGEPSLLVNLSCEISGLDDILRKILLDFYSGVKWAFHRFIWKYHKKLDLRKNIALMLAKLNFRKSAKNSAASPDPKFTFRTEALGSIFNQNDTELIAQAIKDDLISFKWKKGDILLIDNLQMAHSGLPGFGPRVIRTILCNPILLRAASNGAGVSRIEDLSNCQSLLSLMAEARRRELEAL